jgi:hypothetical protein
MTILSRSFKKNEKKIVLEMCDKTICNYVKNSVDRQIKSRLKI